MSKDNMSDQKMEYYTLNAKLCCLVQANPCMYDRSSPNYLKKEYVDRAWANIAKEVNDSVGSCKERWRNIRTAFARSVNIYKTPSGPNRHKRYYLHDELQFLTKHISPGLPCLPIRILTPTEMEENYHNTQQTADVSVDVSECDDNCTFEITIDSNSPSPVHIEEEPVPSPEPDYTETPSSPLAKRRKIIDPEEFLKDLVSKQNKKDPDSEFLNSLLPEMKVMNTRQKILFKGKVFRILEEVFGDTKDFPNKVESVMVNSAQVTSPGKNMSNKSVTSTLANKTTMTNSAVQTHAEQRDAYTSTTLFNVQVPMVMLGQNEGILKREPINVDD